VAESAHARLRLAAKQSGSGAAGQEPWSVLGPNAKTALNTFCQRYTKRQISKVDITYNNVKFGTQVQSTVTLNCIGGAQFAGEVATKDKEAEQNAAKMALLNYTEEIASLEPGKAGGNNKKRKASDAGLGELAGIPGGGATNGAAPGAAVDPTVATRIAEQLGTEAEESVAELIKRANETLEIEPQGTLQEQAVAVLSALVGASHPYDAGQAAGGDEDTIAPLASISLADANFDTGRPTVPESTLGGETTCSVCFIKSWPMRKALSSPSSSS